MRKLRIVQFGCGKASVYTMNYVFEAGAEIVAAFDIDPEIIGKDIGDIIGSEKKYVVVQDVKYAESILRDMDIDACIVTTMCFMSDVKDILLMLARLGINTITSAEEAFFPWNSANKITMEIDAVAKENNCTIAGSGFQDMAWCNLPITLAGVCNDIKEIKITTSFNIENYGAAATIAHGAGLEIETFKQEFMKHHVKSGNSTIRHDINFLPSFAWNSNGWICEKMNLTPIKQTQDCIPHTFNSQLRSNALNMTISASYVTGMTAIVTTETKEGITIVTESIGKIYMDNEEDVNICEIIGTPNIKTEIHNAENIKMACSTLVGRIPDIINARPGFISCGEMPILTYRQKSLEQYIDYEKRVNC